MNNKKIRAIGAGLLVCLWLVLTAGAWFGPVKDISESERRPLEQMPQITMETLLDGKFMSKFESFTLDQFPLRDTFRQIKSLFHCYALNQADNNDIYVADGYAAKLEYPLSQESVDYALKKFQFVYDKYLKNTGSTVFMTVVPDKGYYLAEENGYLAMDYSAMFEAFDKGMPWATYVDLTDTLHAESYYRTDTHWRQEHLLSAAEKLCNAMGVRPFDKDSFTQTALERPFYGVYYGQAALPMKPETLYIMENEILSQCKVYDHETDAYLDVYNMDMVASKDLYDVFLSGAKSLLTIENPNAETGRELIVFRDSFGSSITPLLVRDYAKVTLVDIRYLSSQMLDRFMEFSGQDVLFLYSTLVLNNSNTIK